MNEGYTGIIIAGGKSSRMGQNKALICYDGKRLIDIAIGILKPLTETILVSSNETLPDISNVQIKDKYKGIGPIGGLYSCLLASKANFNLIIPCDVPLITTQFYRELIDNAKNYDAVIPRLADGKLEPLVALYSKDIVDIIHQQILDKNHKLINLFSLIKVKYIDVNNSSIFKNINTPEDII